MLACNSQGNVNGDSFPNVTKSPGVIICCFTHRVNMRVERQRVIYNNTEAANTFRRLNLNVAEINDIERTFRSLSSTGADDDGFGLIWI